MHKILIVSKKTSGGGGLKSAFEFINALKLSKKNDIKIFTEIDAKKEININLKVTLFNFLNKYLQVLINKNNRKISITFPQIFSYLNNKKFSFDIYLIHYVNEFLSIKDIIKFKKPTFIFINDMWFFGGIQHFFDNPKKIFKFSFRSFFEFFNYLSWAFKFKYLSMNSNITFIASSEWLKIIAQNSQMLKKHKVEKIYTPTNINFWKKKSKKTCRKKLKLPNNKKLILFVAKGGFKNYRKGGDIFKEIVKSYSKEKDINFVILGQSNNDQYQYQKNLFYLNFKNDNEKLRDLYNAVDLVICLSRYDNIPYSIIESMSCGIPNISTNVGGIGEIISHKKNGWLLKNKSFSQIKKSINWSLQRINHKKLSKNSIKDVKKKFSYSKILYDYNRICNKIKIYKYDRKNN